MTNHQPVDLEVWALIAAYIPLQARLLLAATSSPIHSMVMNTPSVWHTVEITPDAKDVADERAHKKRTDVLIALLQRRLGPSIQRAVRVIILDGLFVIVAHLHYVASTLPNVHLLSLRHVKGLTLYELANQFKFAHGSRSIYYPEHLRRLNLDGVLHAVKPQGIDEPDTFRHLAKYSSTAGVSLDIALCQRCNSHIVPTTAQSPCILCSGSGEPLCDDCAGPTICTGCHACVCVQCQNGKERLLLKFQSPDFCTLPPHPPLRGTEAYCAWCQPKYRCRTCDEIACRGCRKEPRAVCSACDGLRFCGVCVEDARDEEAVACAKCGGFVCGSCWNEEMDGVCMACTRRKE